MPARINVYSKLQPTIGYEVFTGDHSMKWSTRRTVETVAKPSSGEKNGHCSTMHVGFLLGIPTICRSSVLPHLPPRHKKRGASRDDDDLASGGE